MKRLGAAANGMMVLAVALAPPVFFVLWAYPQVLSRVDQFLATSKPLLEREVSVALERPVHFGKLSPALSLAMLQRVLSKESILLEIEDLELGARPEEQRWAGQSWLVRVPRAEATISLAALQQGKLSENGIPEITLERPEAILYRTPEGTFSLTSFLPKPKMAPDPTKPPFQTLVRLRGAHIHLRDFASPRAPGRLEENHLERLDAALDLTGTRTLRAFPRPFAAATRRGSARAWS